MQTILLFYFICKFINSRAVIIVLHAIKYFCNKKKSNGMNIKPHLTLFKREKDTSHYKSSLKICRHSQLSLDSTKMWK